MKTYNSFKSCHINKAANKLHYVTTFLRTSIDIKLNNVVIRWEFCNSISISSYFELKHLEFKFLSLSTTHASNIHLKSRQLGAVPP